MTNKFLSKGTTFQSEPGPLASVDYVSPDEGIVVQGFAFPTKRHPTQDYIPRLVTWMGDISRGKAGQLWFLQSEAFFWERTRL
jgi:hypothetical protein